ncbi:hypothetical protein DH2020_002940 [Rehmannia glutinosa]|uniref:Alpha/beta hydrolase fold-3 domain-containing protein n=1 Tax=Rehmannia glutinosa TaxID=99300 RepID=A0ABR0XV93_REHGL
MRGTVFGNLLRFEIREGLDFENFIREMFEIDFFYMNCLEKKVIDEVSGWLRLFDDGSVDRTWTGPPQVKFMSEAVPPHHHFIDGVATADITTADGLKLRIYLPENQEKNDDSEKLPILLHFHGGGFCISEADWYMYYTVYTRLARAARAMVVSVYLRRAPEHRLPAACDDGLAALLWLRSVAGKQSHEPWLSDHGDFGRVFLRGQLRREHSPPGGGACGSRRPNPPETRRSYPDPPRILPVAAEQVGDGAAGDTVPDSGNGGQVLEPGFAGGGHQGPPDNVPDGGTRAAAGGVEEAAAVYVLRGGAGPDKGYGNGVL